MGNNNTSTLPDAIIDDSPILTTQVLLKFL